MYRSESGGADMDRAKGATWTKYLSYLSINFGFSLLGMAATMLLMYYYTDVLALPALAVSVILFSARLFDGAIDPFLGHYMDKRSTRLGKYRGYVIYWGPPACVAFALMFFAPPFTGGGRIAWCMLLYLAFTLAFSFVEIASLPMLASFSSWESRSAGNTLKISGCILATLLVALFSMNLVQVLGNGSEQAGYSRMALLFAGVVLTALLIGGLCFREGEGTPTPVDMGVTCSARKAILIVLREKSIVALLCMHLCMDAASAFKMQAGIYYLKYNIGRQDLISLFWTSSIVVSLLTQPLVFYCSRRVNLRTLMVYGCIVSAGAMLMIGLSGNSIPMIITGNCIFGMASAFPANLVFFHMVELSELLGKKQGSPFGGVVNSFMGLASRVGGSVASALLSLILFLTAYTPNQAQTGWTLTGIWIGFVALPVIVLISGGVFASVSFRSFDAEISLQRSAELLSREM